MDRTEARVLRSIARRCATSLVALALVAVVPALQGATAAPARVREWTETYWPPGVGPSGPAGAPTGTGSRLGESVRAAGYLYTGVHWATADLPMTYEINDEGGPVDALSAVRAAFGEWEINGGSAMDYEYLGGTSRGAERDGHNVVSWGAVTDSMALAQCRVWYDADTLHLVEADIVINPGVPWSTSGASSAYDVQAIVTHEAGHTLQLGDLYGEADKGETMYYSVRKGDLGPRTLEDGDLAGIRAIYPSTDRTPPKPPRNLVAAGGNGSIALSWENPPDGDFAAVRVLRSSSGFATSATETATQSMLPEGAGTSLTDPAPLPGVTYYYSAFARDRTGNWSRAATIVGRAGAPSALTLAGAASPVGYGVPTTLTGTLLSEGASVANGIVTLWRSADGGYTWTQDVQAAYDTSSSAYAAVVTLGANTLFRYTFDGDGIHGSAASASVQVGAKALLTTPSTPSRVTRNRAFVVTGIVRPIHRGSTQLRLYRRAGGRWVRYRTVAAPNHVYETYSKYRVSVRLPYKGRWFVLAYHADANHYPTYSLARYFVVR